MGGSRFPPLPAALSKDAARLLADSCALPIQACAAAQVIRVFPKEDEMREIVIGLVFAAMLLSPVVVASMNRGRDKD